ncbi:Aryl-phospho-beta-D-glucosidase BglC, GH1 family [Oscillospiraceae bacterium]|nr:Aryl-phospho-beta-D-glucosidase BglC, GH1 family [Oscillospiraceae bacterium]
MNLRKIASVILMAAMATASAAIVLPGIVRAEAQADVSDVNTWGTGGQITLDLSGCSGYGTITVVVEFTGTVTSASGWGFDSYTIDGNTVTATVSADGPNSWGIDGNVGIQVDGSNINGAELVSISGSGTSTGTTQGTTAATAATTTAPSSSGGNVTPAPAQATGVQGDDWLTTSGDHICDMNGTEVWLTGCNWFGYNTGSNLFDGVWACSLDDALVSIADHGFNLLRVPMSAELLLQWKNGEYPEANYNHAYNPYLDGMNSLEIWDHVLEVCQANGIKVMVDIHSANTDAMGHMAPLWYTSDFTEEEYIEALDWISARYADNDTIVAYDLKNEPHGKASEEEHAIWNGSDDDNNWKRVAEEAGNTILDNNPHALIVIEGIQIYPIDPQTNDFTSTDDEDYYNSWWGGNLRAVADYPIDFGSPERNAQIVYSPHDYGPAVYAQPWFEGGFTYESLIEDYWYDSWLYIDDTGTAPLLIGEWGGFMTGDNLTWMEYMRQLISEYHLNHTFWCFNANSGDTGGLVMDDFTTWDEEKYEFVREVLWQNEDGQFIGLDHEVPLGANGIALSDYDGVMIDLDLEVSDVVPEDTCGGIETVATDMTGNTCGGVTGPEGGSIFQVTKGGKIAFAVAGVAILGLVGSFVTIAIKNQRNGQ